MAETPGFVDGIWMATTSPCHQASLPANIETSGSPFLILTAVYAVKVQKLWKICPRCSIFYRAKRSENWGRVVVRSELVSLLAKENPELLAQEIEKIVDLFFHAVVDHLASGGRVELRGFGAFSTRQHAARTGRNPRSGATVPVPAKRSVHFKPGKAMRERLIAAAANGTQAPLSTPMPDRDARAA